MNFFFESLTGRLFKLVFGWYLALAIGVTSTQLAWEYVAINRMIASDLNSLGQSFGHSVAEALWAFDRPLLKSMVQGIAQSTIVTGVRVESSHDNIDITTGQIPPPDSLVESNLFPLYQYSMTSLDFTTPQGTESLGRLTIYSDRSIAFERVKNSFLTILINSLIKTAGLWVIFYLVINKGLSRPLNRLTDIVSRFEFVANSQKPIALDYPHQDEFGRLVGAMSKMQERMFAAHGELEKVNSRLEETVIERTKNLSQALEFSETILLNSPLAMGVYTADGQCVRANDAYAILVGTTREALLVQNFHHIAAWEKSRLLGDCLTSLAHKTPAQGEIEAVTSFGKDLCLEYRIIPILLNDEDHLLIQFFDLTERKQMEEELRHSALHDALTRLPNRRLLLDRLTRALHASKRQSSYGAVLFLDLNLFKQLNDAHGHDIGDKLLFEVAQRLQQLVRDCDTVARLGGDEFVVLLEGLGATPAEANERATAVMQKIRESLGEEYVLGHIRYHCSASIGLKLFIGDNVDPDQILHEADAAMYEEKKARPSH